jgi:hypothetical protein
MPAPFNQTDWRWCKKCQGLTYAGNPSLGPCPAGGDQKRFGLFPFVRSEHNPTSTKNENKKHGSSMLKKINRPREQKEIYEPAHT